MSNNSATRKIISFLAGGGFTGLAVYFYLIIVSDGDGWAAALFAPIALLVFFVIGLIMKFVGKWNIDLLAWSLGILAIMAILVVFVFIFAFSDAPKSTALLLLNSKIIK